MEILQVSTRDTGGGAEQIAWNFFQEYRRAGHGSRLAVGKKLSADPDVFEIGSLGRTSRWTAIWKRLSRRLDPWAGRVRGAARLQVLLETRVARPQGWLSYWHGYEDFDYPETEALLGNLSRAVSIMHCHNLHGGYFDLRALPKLCRRSPVLLTLHDAWMLSGHCAHSLDCTRWESGCGRCPRLDLPPAILRDGTARNWAKKKEIYRDCRLWVATPSQWLLNKVNASILGPAVVEGRVIRNGIDLAVFCPGDKLTARNQLGFSADARILLFSAKLIHKNLYKDFALMRQVMQILGRDGDREEIILVALGDRGSTEHYGRCEIRYTGWCAGQAAVATYYQAADIYLHAAKEETFPTAILEALACGVPVVATAVGGIPEQVVSVDGLGHVGETERGMPPTGVLVPPGDAHAMSRAVRLLLADATLRNKLSEGGVRQARERYCIKGQAKKYLEYYEAICRRFKEEQSKKREQ